MVDCVGPDQLDRAARVLRGGGLVAFATETVYGLGANALDVNAVARVFEVKGRPRFDPLIVHVADVDAARRLAAAWPEAAQRLAEAFWPGPMTLVVEKHAPAHASARAPATERVIPDLVTAGLPTVALRVPGHETARELIRRAGVPVAAPSANRFGGVSPTRAAHVVEELGAVLGGSDLVLDGGPCETGVESTVLSVVGGEGVVLLRPGGVSLERIEGEVGPVGSASGGGGGDEGRSEGEPDAAVAAESGLVSPGMLARHYAPRRARLVLVDRLEPTDPALAGADASPGAIAALLLAASDEAGARGRAEALRQRGASVRALSATGDLKEAAANLFAALRELDASGAELILAERAPEHGLGRAINDRLRRAAGQGERDEGATA